MRKQFYEHPKKPLGGKRSEMMLKLLLALFMICVSFSIIQAQELTLTGTPTGGQNLILTVPAKIMRITRTEGVESYTVWLNGSPYVTIRRFNEKNGVNGVLPPGEYALRTIGGSVTIYLNTAFQQFNTILWGRQNAIVKPLLDGNFVILNAPTAIAEATYDGTKGMSIRRGSFNGITVLHYLSPHNIQNPGPIVLNAQGTNVGKTLVNQLLPPGVYCLVPERRTPEGIVYGQIVFRFPGSAPSPLPFIDNFDQGLNNWDVSNIQPNLTNGQLFWNEGNHNGVYTNFLIPLENIVIEFDGWTETNGIAIEWKDSQNNGYNVSIGAHFNTASYIGQIDNGSYDWSINKEVFIQLKKWQHYKIIQNGKSLITYLDGDYIGEYNTNTSFSGNGLLRFSTYNLRLGIDNVRIYRTGEGEVIDSDYPGKSDYSLSGQWLIKQSNNYSGTLNLQQDQAGRLTGTANWGGNLNGTINGRISGNAVEFTISYPGGIKGFYKGSISQDGTRIANGIVNSSTNETASWDATKR